MTVVAARELTSAARAFDAVAEEFDGRFGEWLSVAAQRRAVRQALGEAFPAGSRLVEIGGGTGEDALWLARRGCEVLLTDPSPAMVGIATSKFAGTPQASAEVAGAENLGVIEGRDFDGAYSNFAALNCVDDLRPFASGLARLVRPGAPALLVLFGTHSPGEILVEALRGRPRNMFRRWARGRVEARLGGQEFTVRYHRKSEIVCAMAPWFEFQGRQGIGVFVPPSAAEPWISGHPNLLARLEALDRALSPHLAMLGDHILYRFVRSGVPLPAHD